MSRVWVKSIAPNNLHGFRVNQLVLNDLTEGLNVVFASNASGKSTLAKAIVNLFQPEALDSDATINGVVWSGREFVGLSRRRREAKFGGFPGRTKDYFLDLQSLLQGLGQEAQVQELLAKGYKFAEPIKLTPADTSNDVKSTRAQLDQLKEARRRKQALLSEEQKLPELARLVSEAEESRSNSEALEAVLEQLELQARKESLDSSLSDACLKFPGIHKQIVAQAGELDQAVRTLKKFQREEAELQDTLRRIGANSIPLRTLSDPDRLRIQFLADELKRVQILRERVQHELESTNSAAIRERERVFRLAPDQDLDALPCITEGHFRDILRVADLADADREQNARSEGFNKALGDWNFEERYRIEELERIQRRLIEWLEFESSESAPLNWRPVCILAVAGVLAILPNLIVERVGLLAVGLALAVYSMVTYRPTSSPEKPSLTGLPPEFTPPDPNNQSVAELLNRISQLLSYRQTADRLQLLAQSTAESTEDWHELIEGLDLRVDDPYRLRIVSEAASNYVNACRDVARLEQDLEDQTEREANLLDELHDLYGSYDYPVKPNREVESLGDFLAWFKTAAQIHVKSTELASEIGTIHEFLDSHGIPPGPDLSVRIEHFVQRLPVSQTVQTAREEIALIEAKMESRFASFGRVGKLFGLEDTTEANQLQSQSVRNEIENQNRLASELDSRRERYQELLIQIRQAEQSGSIDSLETTYRAGLAKVEARWEAECQRAVRFRVSEVIRERLMTEDLPPVLQTANDYLRRFSVDRYRLEFARNPDEALGVITVVDLLDGKTQTFPKLSTGTKVHVLLGLRLALIEEQEKLTSDGRLKFPVLVDEAMAVSDPESSRAIAEALIHVSRERQVIVFTSQDRDVSLLKSLAPELHIHSLNSELTVPEYVDSGLARTLVAPSTHHFDPRFPIGAHAVAAIFGPRVPGGGQRIDQVNLERRNAVIVKGLECARKELVDRYPRLTWDECSDQKWAQTAFAPRLQEFLDECSGCPHRFIAALGANRGQAFNRNQLDAAGEWLDEQGYLIEQVSVESLAEVLTKNLEAQDRDTWESMVRIFGIAFIPGFDPESSSLLSTLLLGREAKNYTRRPKRTEGESPNVGLFDDFFTS